MAQRLRVSVDLSRGPGCTSHTHMKAHVSNSSSRGGEDPLPSLALMLCTDMHAGKTLIHVKLIVIIIISKI